jgi:hypothetical protein
MHEYMVLICISQSHSGLNLAIEFARILKEFNIDTKVRRTIK